MTKPYNGSPITALEYLKYSFDVKVIDNKNWFYNDPDDNNMINDKDIEILYF